VYKTLLDAQEIVLATFGETSIFWTFRNSGVCSRRDLFLIGTLSAGQMTTRLFGEAKNPPSEWSACIFGVCSRRDLFVIAILSAEQMTTRLFRGSMLLLRRVPPL